VIVVSLVVIRLPDHLLVLSRSQDQTHEHTRSHPGRAFSRAAGYAFHLYVRSRAELSPDLAIVSQSPGLRELVILACSAGSLEDSCSRFAPLRGSAIIVIIGQTILLGLFDQMPLTLLLLGALCGFLAPLIHLTLEWLIGSPHPIKDKQHACLS
jgi:hypothetical protein